MHRADIMLIAHSFFIFKDQELNYNFLLEVEDLLIQSLVPGATLSSAYNKVVEHVRTKRPELEKHLTKVRHRL